MTQEVPLQEGQATSASKTVQSNSTDYKTVHPSSNTTSASENTNDSMNQTSLLQGGQAPYPRHQGHLQPQPMPNTGIGNTLAVGVGVGSKPLRTTCPNCNLSIQTVTVRKYKTLAHLICLGLCLMCCCLFSWIPYCIDSMYIVQHTCPNCRAHLGTYGRPTIL